MAAQTAPTNTFAEFAAWAGEVIAERQAVAARETERLSNLETLARDNGFGDIAHLLAGTR